MNSKISNLVGGLVFLSIGFGANLPAHAVSIGIAFKSGSTLPNDGPSTFNLGWSFTANSNVYVVALGNFYGALFPQEQQVGLWNSSGTLLASAYVDNNSEIFTNHMRWRFTSIAPVLLTAGQTYVVGGQGGADYTGEVPHSKLTINSKITYITDLYTSNGGANSPLLEPTLTESSPYGWFGGNILLSNTPINNTPIPAALPLFGSGLLGMFALSRRRRAKKFCDSAAP